MADLNDYKKVKLTDIAYIERAVKDRVYPAGTVYIQVSACRRAGLDQFFLTSEAGPLESKYAVILPKERTDSVYMVEVLNLNADSFMYKYVGTNINIQLDSFKWFELEWHPNYETQKNIGLIMTKMREEDEREEQTIEDLKDFKKWMLSEMMC